MANYYISTTGTKTTGTSTVDDWSDANCYTGSNFTAIAEANTDTFVFDAGSHVLTAAWAITSGIVISIRGNGDVTLVGAAASHVLQGSGTDGQTFEINDVKLDMTLCTTAAFAPQNRTGSYTVTLNNVEIINNGSAASYGILHSQRRGTANYNNLTFTGTYASRCMDSSTSLGDGDDLTININGLHFNNVIHASASVSYGLLFVKGNYATTVTININNVTGSIDKTGYENIVGIRLRSFNNPVIEDCNFSVISDATAGSNGIQVYGEDAVNRVTDGAIIRNNIIDFNCSAGDAISCGLDTESGLGYTTNSQIHHCTAGGTHIGVGSPHGIVFRGLASGLMYANISHTFDSPMMLSTCTDDAVQCFGNLIYDAVGVCLSLKGNSGGQMHNNTAVITPPSDGSVSRPYGIWARIQSATENTASKTYNNNILWLGDEPKLWGFARVNELSDNTFSNNNYYSDQPLVADPFAYQATSYATLALWNAARETNDATDNANFAGNAAEIIANYGDVDLWKLLASTTTFGGGLKWWFGANPDTLGEPLSSFDIDQGIQSQNGDFHPTNL